MSLTRSFLMVKCFPRLGALLAVMAFSPTLAALAQDTDIPQRDALPAQPAKEEQDKAPTHYWIVPPLASEPQTAAPPSETATTLGTVESQDVLSEASALGEVSAIHPAVHDAAALMTNRLESLVVQQTEGAGDAASGTTPSSGLGGPASVEGQLQEDAAPTEPVLRLPAIDDFLQPYFDWKTRLNEDTGFSFGLDYSLLYQVANSSPTDNRDAFGGVFRVYGDWTLVNWGGENPGGLVFKLENRHQIGPGVAPAGLGFETGYLGIPGTNFSGAGTSLTNLFWKQRFGGRAGFDVGKLFPDDYADVLGYANPWTTFSNVSLLINPTIAYPDAGFGIAGGSYLGDQWYALGVLSDANATYSNFDFYSGGAEFFKYAEVGWTPSPGERFFKNIHFGGWHTDARTDAGVGQNYGFAVAANWTFDNNRWMPFFRAGWSDGESPLANAAVTVGVLHYFPSRSDVTGLGFNWSSPPDDALRDQFTTELFYRLQLAQNLAVTPSVQFLVNPALNPNRDSLFLFGLRARLTL